MKTGAPALVIAALLAACSAATPLTLEQRLLNDSDAPGSLPDPVETRETATTVDQFHAWQDIPAAEIEPSALEEAGFVSAIHETRYLPETAGGPHVREAPHVRVLVVEFDSRDGAVAGVDLLHEQALQPCPGTCAARIEEMDVSGVPNAKGVQRPVTAERLQETGEEGEPTDEFIITFADGQFAYQVQGSAPAGEITKQQVEDIAKNLYDRVAGAPASTTGA
jgi:hypothetical protein